MKSLFVIILVVINTYNVFSQSDEKILANIYQMTLTNSPIYENLRYLTKEIGNRINGSPQLAAAIEFTRQLMIEYQFDSVYLQPVMVPNWKRDKNEIVKILNSPSIGNQNLNCIALGNSIDTGDEGLSGEVIEINGMDALKKADKNLVNGKIVFLNQPIDNGLVNILEGYSEVFDQRTLGASQSSIKGAKAVIIRSITTGIDDSPHTGNIFYEEGVKKIPAVTISTNDADKLSKLLKREPNTKIYLELHCKTLANVLSYNVMGEIKGNQFPDEIISVGAHIDSWDVGEGAHDDGAGCLQAIEVLRSIRALNIQPKHTLRVVLWVDEENNVSGGKAYAEKCQQNKSKNIAALESDFGGFLPLGFYIDTDNALALSRIISWKKYFEPYQIFQFNKGVAGVDVYPLKNNSILLMGLMTNLQRYSTLHHSDKDVFEEVDKRELELGAAAMTSIVYLIDKYGLE
jgi:carboxypeptidase Q